MLPLYILITNINTVLFYERALTNNDFIKRNFD